MSQTLEHTADVIEEPLYEVVDGERKELEPMGALQTLVASRLSRRMGNYAEEHDLGEVVTEMLFLLNEETNLQRRPDIAFVSNARWPEVAVDSSAAWNVVPDLAIEVVSPSNAADEIDKKLTEYFESGVRLAWVIHPESGHVYAYFQGSPRAAQRLERSDRIDGGDVLPGFELEIDSLFRKMRRRG